MSPNAERNGVECFELQISTPKDLTEKIPEEATVSNKPKKVLGVEISDEETLSDAKAPKQQKTFFGLIRESSKVPAKVPSYLLPFNASTDKDLTEEISDEEAVVDAKAEKAATTEIFHKETMVAAEATKQPSTPFRLIRKSSKALAKVKTKWSLRRTSSVMVVPENLIVKMLPRDILENRILSMLPRSHRFLAPVCGKFRDACEVKYEGRTETYLHGMASTKQIEMYLDESDESNDQSEYPSHDIGPRVAKRYVAAGTGQQDLIKWAGLTPFVSCRGAARGGHLETLKWMREERNCRWNWKTCAAAMLGGHLEVFEYARANGCNWKYPYNTVETCEDLNGSKTEISHWERFKRAGKRSGERYM
mmetsp:Transcript_11991/g.23889  ORF Transcript_11991/g.23889 Transcript_11991/m.23889 type:complete len:363 (-) Transcript_11991:194-1282(-)